MAWFLIGLAVGTAIVISVELISKHKRKKSSSIDIQEIEKK